MTTPLTELERYSLAAYQGVVGAFAVSSYSAVIVATLYHRRTVRSSVTVPEIAQIGTDLAVSIASVANIHDLILNVYSLLWPNAGEVIYSAGPRFRQREADESACTLYAFASLDLAIVQLFLVPFIALDRLSRARECFTRFRRVSVYLWTFIVILLLSTLVAALPLFGIGRYSLIPTSACCFLDLLSGSLGNRAYVVIFMLSCYLFPLSLATIAYSRLYKGLLSGAIDSVPWCAKGREGWVMLLSVGSVYVAFCPLGVVVITSMLQGPFMLPRFLNILPAYSVKVVPAVDVVLYFLINPRVIAMLKSTFSFSRTYRTTEVQHETEIMLTPLQC